MKKRFVLSVAWWLGCFLLLCFIMGFSIASADVIENRILRVAVTVAVIAASCVVCWFVARWVLRRWGNADETVLVLDAGDISGLVDVRVRARGVKPVLLRLRLGGFLLRLGARVTGVSLEVGFKDADGGIEWGDRDFHRQLAKAGAAAVPRGGPVRALFRCHDCDTPMSSCRCGKNARCPDCGLGWSASPCDCTGLLLEPEGE